MERKKKLLKKSLDLFTNDVFQEGGGGKLFGVCIGEEKTKTYDVRQSVGGGSDLSIQMLQDVLCEHPLWPMVPVQL
jgi:hypothetical protein